MIRTVVVAGALLLGVGAATAQQDVAVKQDNLMRAQAKSLYTVMLKMVKGEIPYDQAAVDAAIAQLEASVSARTMIALMTALSCITGLKE